MINQNIKEKVEKINQIGEELKQYILEKDEVIHLIKVALISKRNVFFLGKTGQAKSYTVREFIKRIEGANYFEILMNKMLDTENIFGRLDIPSLIKGDQKIITKGKLPEANINFLDEIFKSNEVILNSLLQVLNYEEINLEGNLIQPPTISTFTASNEIPDFNKPEDEILYPLYNRLHLKCISEYIKDKENFKKAVKVKREGNKLSTSITTITLDELKELNEAVRKVEVPENIDELMWEICEEIKNKLNREVSDRKKIEYSIIVQAEALLKERDKVNPEDLSVLIYYLWETPEEIEVITDIIKRYTENPIKEKVENIIAMFVEQIEETKQISSNADMKQKTKALVKVENEIKTLYKMLQKIEEETKTDKDKNIINETYNYFEEEYKNVIKKMGYTYIPIKEQIMKEMV